MRKVFALTVALEYQGFFILEKKMVYFSREWTDSLLLPDGSIASSVAGLEKYMKVNNCALREDYSDEYLKARRRRNEKAQRDELFSEFIHNYKRSIWYE